MLTFPLHEINNNQPLNLDIMIEIAKKLSIDLPYVRIDLYNYKNQIYFGEITLYTINGMDKIYPNKYDLMFGDLIDLNYLK
jgi:hypothetical protein